MPGSKPVMPLVLLQELNVSSLLYPFHKQGSPLPEKCSPEKSKNHLYVSPAVLTLKHRIFTHRKHLAVNDFETQTLGALHCLVPKILIGQNVVLFYPFLPAKWYKYRPSHHKLIQLIKHLGSIYNISIQFKTLFSFPVWDILWLMNEGECRIGWVSTGVSYFLITFLKTLQKIKYCCYLEFTG